MNWRMVEKRWLWFHNSFMPARITIRNVPDDVHKELKERAALRGQSMQEYLRRELERIASRPSADILLERIRKRKQEAGTSVSSDIILQERDADRT